MRFAKELERFMNYKEVQFERMLDYREFEEMVSQLNVDYWIDNISRTIWRDEDN